MPELLPDCKAEVSKGDWLFVGDEESLAGGGSGGHEVLGCEDVRVGDVADVGDIP